MICYCSLVSLHQDGVLAEAGQVDASDVNAVVVDFGGDAEDEDL